MIGRAILATLILLLLAAQGLAQSAPIPRDTLAARQLDSLAAALRQPVTLPRDTVVRRDTVTVRDTVRVPLSAGARDSAIARVLQVVIDTLDRDRTRPSYVTRARARLDSLRLALLLPPPDTAPTPPAPPPAPEPPPVDTVQPPNPPSPPDSQPAPQPPPPAGVAELPRAVPVVPAGLADLPCTVTVPAGGLQAALTAARGGAVLCLTGTHTGNFTVPARTDAGWVVIRSTGVIPAGRMRPTQAVALAKVVSPNVLSALKFAPRSVRTLVLGVEITSASTLVDGPTALVEVGTATETTVADLPTDIAFQQVYIHGWPTQRIRRAFALNGGAQTVRDSWCSEIHAAGFDSQCTISWNSTGPILIENNTFEAASENIMFGGADPRIPGVIARDITIRRNHIAKPIAWKGMGWNVKNLIETKSSARVLVEENVLDGAWLDGQTGYAFVLKSTNQEGGCRWCYSSDWTIRRNLVRNTASGFTIGGRADGTVTDSTNHRFVIEENWIEPLNVAPYSGDGRPIMFTSDNVDVVLRGNVFAGGSPSVAVLFDATNPAVTNLTMTGNVIPRGQYGLLKGGSGEGLASWQAGPTGTKTWSNNALIGSTTVSYPAGTSWHATLASALAVAGVPRATIDAAVAGVVVSP